MRIILRCATALAFSVVGLSAQEATVVSFHHQGRTNAPDGAYQGIAATSITMGSGTDQIPCFNCFPGATGSVTFGTPLYLVAFGPSNDPGRVFVTLLIEDTDYTGPCTGVYVLVQNDVTVLSGQHTISGGCVAETDYVFNWRASLDIAADVSGVLKGGVAIAAGPVASAVVQPMQFSGQPPPVGLIGPRRSPSAYRSQACHALTARLRLGLRPLSLFPPRCSWCHEDKN